MPEEKSVAADANTKLRVIEEAYAVHLPQRLQEIASALQHCLDEPADETRYGDLLIKLHRLAGSAGTFGFAELGMRASEIEMLLNAFLGGTAPSGKDIVPVAARIREMLRWAASGSGTQVPSQAAPPQALQAARKPVAVAPATTERLIYLVHDNTALANDAAAQLRFFGYEVIMISELARLQQAIDVRLPAAVVLELEFPAGILTGAEEVSRIRIATQQRFGVIFVSTRSSFETRLATVRAGADGYFLKPLDMAALIDRLDALTVQEDANPYRVLIIDDDAETARFYAAVLQDAGMDVRILHEPAAMLQVLGEYRPELVLMDIYMPACSGLELSRLIRQDNAYLDVPIVFLSGEADVEKQLNAIATGADDFLTKPIKPAHLISALTSRARRYRMLRGLIMRDGLTGLLNHSALKEQLMREIARAQRSQSPLALAMIDIDHFKRINDSHGHPIGDQVIRSLSRLLVQRLRRGDVIGRYGGEEFAVVMPGTPASSAAIVLEQIRESFSNILHHGEQFDFTATFSAGVAEVAAAGSAEALLQRADAMLYEAKGDGRNRVRVG